MTIQLITHPHRPHQFNDQTGPFVYLRQFTDQPIDRLYMVRHLVAKVLERQVAGDIVDCSPQQGGIAALCAHTARTRGGQRQTFLFGDFDEPTSGDSVDQCRQAMLAAGIGYADYTITPSCRQRAFAVTNVDRIAVLHINAADLKVLQLSLERFFDQVQPGGLILLQNVDQAEGWLEVVEGFALANDADIEIEQLDETSCYLFKAHAPYCEPV